MIGFEYKGQVAYITRMDDFRDYMEPEVDILEDEMRDIDAVQAEREKCEEERDALQEKVDTLTHHIKELINQYYQRYIKTEEIIPELEKLI